MNIKNGMADVGSVNVAVWTNNNEKKFILLVEEDVMKGNKPKTTFLRPAGHCTREALTAQTRKNYDNTQLRNKFNQLRTSQKDCSNSIKEKGNSWNSRTGTVTATDEMRQCLYKVKSCTLRNGSSNF